MIPLHPTRAKVATVLVSAIASQQQQALPGEDREELLG